MATLYISSHDWELIDGDNHEAGLWVDTPPDSLKHSISTIDIVRDNITVNRMISSETWEFRGVQVDPVFELHVTGVQYYARSLDPVFSRQSLEAIWNGGN